MQAGGNLGRGALFIVLCILWCLHTVCVLVFIYVPEHACMCFVFVFQPAVSGHDKLKCMDQRIFSATFSGTACKGVPWTEALTTLLIWST